MLKKNKIIINPEYSAVAAQYPFRPSRAVQAATEAFKQENLNKVAEIGCGLLANTPHILDSFPFVILVDTKAQYQRIKNKLDDLKSIYSSYKEFMDVESFLNKELQLDGAIIINVLHILPLITKRIELLNGVHRNLKKRGFIFIDVPSNETYYRNIVKTAKPYEDGYIMSRGNYYTFYKNMTLEELMNYAEKASFQFKQRIYLDHRVTFVCQKM